MSLPGRWHAALAEGWSDNADQAPLRAAALGLAIDFGAWRTLALDQQLDDTQVIQMMAALVTCAASDALAATRRGAVAPQDV
jgi:hypothetical protein